MGINQSQINKLNFATLVAIKASRGRQGAICVCDDQETLYRYEENGVSFTANDRSVLITGDGGNTRWLGVGGRYGLVSLTEIEHLDATSGSATLLDADLNKIYYIQAAATTTTITIPDPSTANDTYFIRMYKESGDGNIVVETDTGQPVIGLSSQTIVYNGQGFYIKSDNTVEWLALQDSRSDIPVSLTIIADYGSGENWQFDNLLIETSSNNITATFPADISGFPKGAERKIFNIGTNEAILNPNGNPIDGSTANRVIAQGGYLILKEVDGEVKILGGSDYYFDVKPDDITNLEIWLDGADLTTITKDGVDLVSVWQDKSGNANHFSAAGGDQPLWVDDEQNSKDTIQFDGVANVMSAGDVEIANNTRGLTLMAVVKNTVAKRQAIISKYQTTGDNREFAFGEETCYLFEDLTWVSATDAYLTLAVNTYQIVEYVWVPGEAFKLYNNGSLQDTGSAIVTDMSDGTANLKIGGGDFTSVGFWEGNFAEIIGYSDALSETDRENLRNNLAIKWNVPNITINSNVKYWSRDADTSTLLPSTTNDNVNIGSGNIITTGEVGRDTDNSLDFSTDDQVDLTIGGVTTSVVSVSTGVADNDKLVTQGYVDDEIAASTYAHVLRVSTNGTLDFTSIKSAIDSVVGNGPASRWLVEVGPGIYVESPITMKAYVDVISLTGPIQTAIVANTAGTNLLTGSGSNTLEGFTLAGTTGASLINMSIASATMIIKDIMVYNCSTGLEVTNGIVIVNQFNAIVVPATTVGTFIDITGSGDALLKAIGTALGTSITTEFNVSGVSAKATVHGAFFRGTSTTCVNVDASYVNIVDTYVLNTATAININNNCRVNCSTVFIDQATCTIHINSGDTTSVLHMTGGEMDREKFTGPVGYQAETLNFTDSNDSLNVVLADQSIGRPEFGRTLVTGEGNHYTQYMVVLTTDSTATGITDGGNITDVSSAAASPTGSTFTFQGTAANHTILIGTERANVSDMLKVESIRMLQTTAAVEVTRRSFIFEKWTGAAWEESPIFSYETDELYRYANEVFIRSNSDENITLRPLNTWTKKTIASKNLYWFRIRITTAVTTSPVWQQMFLQHSFTKFNHHGHIMYNGFARYKVALGGGGNIFGESGGVGTSNFNVGSGGLPTGWAHNIKNSVLNGNGDAIYYQTMLPKGVCTSCPLIIRAVLHVIGAGASTDGTFIISILPVEVSGNTIADPTGGILPTSRLLTSTETLTAKAGSTTTLSVPFATENKLILLESDALDISNYYEGDMIIVRIELDDEGSGNKNVAVWGSELIGVLWTNGEVL